jgi:diguanylate cyclase (GGDEF)-like protein
MVTIDDLRTDLPVMDVYLEQNTPRSILCLPILNQGKLVALLYLENNITAGVFTPERLELLKLLCAQAAISLVNARLYTQAQAYAKELKEANTLLADYNTNLEKTVAERTEELQKANQKLLELATSDGLTHIPNRRLFDQTFQKEWKRHIREQEPLSIILIDIDYFKHYNDYYGHLRGDDCLYRVAQAISQVPKRAADLVARYGGEEFAIILPNTLEAGAKEVAEVVRNSVLSLEIPHAQSDVSDFVSLSLGIATVVPNNQYSAEDLLAQADHALYQAKKLGRNQSQVNSTITK